jgi:hypothetical protein
MNQLQHIPEEEYGPVLCTLNPLYNPKEEKTVLRVKYEHPMFIREVGRDHSA